MSLRRDVVGVVQRRHGNGGSRDEHRLQHRERSHGARPSDVDLDPLQQGGLLLRRKLERDRPARKLAGGAEEAPIGQLVDLDDHPVGVERRASAALLPLAAEPEQLVDARAALTCGSTGRPHGDASRSSVSDVGMPENPLPGPDELVEERAQAPPGDERGLQVPERASRGISRDWRTRLARVLALAR